LQFVADAGADHDVLPSTELSLQRDALAEEFLICQRWFAAHPGPTFPNRFYTLTGRLNRDEFGRAELINPEHELFVPTWEKNIFDHLSEQGVSWHCYEHEYGFLRLFARYTTETNGIFSYKDPERGFVASARAGTLPAVTFIDPEFSNYFNGNDDQPPADIARGQHLIGEVVNALIKSDLWEKTLLVITYDEHGGFFDHVTPPADAPAVSDIGVYGVRVPAFIVSPWVDKKTVSDIVFDHTSILKTIIRRFLSAHPPDMGERVAKANDLSSVLRTTARTEPVNIPLPDDPGANVAHALVADEPLEGDRDFRALLRSVRSRYPIQ
jgi:phospholipase C